MLRKVAHPHAPARLMIPRTPSLCQKPDVLASCGVAVTFPWRFPGVSLTFPWRFALSLCVSLSVFSFSFVCFQSLIILFHLFVFFLLHYLFGYGLLESSKNTRQHNSDNVLGTGNKLQSWKGS